jgi:hypothetical protein
MLRCLSLATDDGHAGSNDLGSLKRLGLIGCTNERAVRLANNSLGDITLARVPCLSCDDNLHCVSTLSLGERVTVNISRCCVFSIH